jgi:hypothetical protein
MVLLHTWLWLLGDARARWGGCKVEDTMSVFVIVSVVRECVLKGKEHVGAVKGGEVAGVSAAEQGYAVLVREALGGISRAGVWATGFGADAQMHRGMACGRELR